MEQESMDTQAESSSPSLVASVEAGQLKPLDIDTVRELWSKTYNTEGISTSMAIAYSLEKSARV